MCDIIRNIIKGEIFTEKPREQMTYDKALEILNLNRGFSEQELKKAYRSLARLHHPDNFTKESKEVIAYHEGKMKEINEAYDFFDKLKKQNGNYYEVFDVDAYRREIASKIDAYYQNAKIGDNDLIEEVKEIAKASKFLLVLSDEETSIDKLFKGFLKSLKKCYEDYQENLFKQEFVFLEDIKEEIKYDASVEVFYKQMQNLKDKYSRSKLFKKRINEECEKYKLYALYDKRIAELIKVLQNNAKIKAEGVNYKEIDTYIAEMHKEIEDVFSSVAFINSELASLSEMVKGISDNQILEEYNRLVQSNNNGDSISDIKNGFVKLKELILKYREKENFIAQNKPSLNAMFMSIQKSFNEAMTAYNETADIDSMRRALEIYEEFLSAYRAIISGDFDISMANVLARLTFSDFDGDNDILNQVYQNNSINNIFIFSGHGGNSLRFAMLVLKDDGYHMIRDGLFGGLEEVEIDITNLGGDYVNLDEFLTQASFMGLKVIDSFGLYDYIVLYTRSDANICLDGSGKIVINHIKYLSIKSDSRALPYKDKTFLKQEIARQLQNKLDTTNQKTKEVPRSR